MVSSNWEAPVAATCPIERFYIKLKILSRGLQGWSQRRVSHIKSQLAMAKEILHRIEIACDLRQLSVEEDWLRMNLKKHCLGLAYLDRTIARQSSHILFLKEGDVNTSFFHQHARYRKIKNFITKFLVDDQVVTSQVDKQSVVFDFYSRLLGSPKQISLTLDSSMIHHQ